MMHRRVFFVASSETYAFVSGRGTAQVEVQVPQQRPRKPLRHMAIR